MSALTAAAEPTRSVARVAFVDAATNCDAALRVVLDHRENDTMKQLREENERLRATGKDVAASNP